MRVLAVVVVLGACGRIGFAPLTGSSGTGDDGGGSGDAAPVRPTPCMLTSTTSLGLEAFATDAAGNAYVLLDLNGIITLGSQVYTNADTTNDYIAVALDPSCAVRWARQFAMSTTAGGIVVVGRKTIIADGSGGAFIGADFLGSIDPGGATHNATGGSADEDLFATHIDSTGAVTWFQTLGTVGGELAGGLALTPDGGVIMGGNFAGTINLGAGNVTSAGMDDILLVGYSSSGTLVPGKNFGSAANEYVARIASDAVGNIYAAGSFNGGASNLGGGVLANAGSYDGFTAAYSGTLASRWGLGFDGTGFEYSFAVAVGQVDQVTTVGEFDTPVDFGFGSVTPAGMRDVYVVASNSAAPRWVRTFGSAQNEGSESVVIDNAGDVVVAGGFSSTIDFGLGPVTPSGAESFIVGLASDGTTKWVETIGTGASISTSFLAPLAPAGDAVAVAFFGTLMFGGTSYDSTGKYSVLIAQVH